MKEEENGHLFSIENEEEFHRALHRVLSDPAHGRRMAENGHRLTVAEYDTLILSRRIKSLYEEIIREKA
jgi:glycosyltransferase involved in cell wall biosynthesis